MVEMAQQERFPKNINFLTLVLCFYLAAPLYNVPLLGLSLSAPVVFILFFDVMRSGGLQVRRLPRLLILLFAMFCAVVLSLFWNEIFGGGLEAFGKAIKSLIRYVYWGLVCLMAFRLFSRSRMLERAARIFALAMVLLAAVILAEFLVYGGLQRSGWSHWVALSQNSFAWQFSTFLPFVYAAFMEAQGKARMYWGGGLALCLLAVIILSSRTGWGTATIGLLVYAVLYAITTRQAGKAILVVAFALLVGVVALQSLPERFSARIFQDYGSMENLERDKSWMIRQIQISKGINLFMENPVFGVGPGQFTSSETFVDLPDIFSSRSMSDFMDRSAHNSYIQLLAEGGLSFIIPFGLLLFWLVVAGGRAAMELAIRGNYKGLALASGFVGMSVHFWTVSGITGTAPWFVYGMAAAMVSRVRWQRQNETACVN